MCANCQKKSVYKLRNEVDIGSWICQKTCDSWIGNPGCIVQDVTGNVGFLSVDLAPKFTEKGSIHFGCYTWSGFVS